MTAAERGRLAELLAALSLATDHGNGFPAEKTLRNTAVALGIAAELGVDERERSDLLYASLLRFVGCTAFSYETWRMTGNEFAALEVFAPADDAKPAESLHALFQLGRGTGPVRRARTIARSAIGGKAFGDLVVRADCEANARFARRFGMSAQITQILDQSYERWDGKGAPHKLRGNEIALGTRILTVAHQVEFFHRTDGREGAREMVRRRSGGWFDPACAQAFERCRAPVLERIEAGSVWEEVIDAEPEPRVFVGEQAIDDIAAGFADFVDLKSPYLLGHSSGVARIATAAAGRAGLSNDDVKTLERASLFHDLGRVGVSNAIWDKRGALSPAEWEQVRLHAYHGERVLARSPLLAGIGALAGLHHERLDGSGYHRGVPASALSPSARILAAADVYQALTELRPHRPAFSPEAAVAEIEREVAGGRLDRDAAEAVCAAAGTALPKRPSTWPAGLTDREVEILRLLARGRSKKEIAAELLIAPGTVHTHVTHIYAKIGSSTRAGAALFAMEHDLIR